ncbi:MAG: LuxR family transcriptional regulator, partial [Actinobacteria bacterium]|nr:LuxR family transcriptional regulator [Actinomycetota bacterium]
MRSTTLLCALGFGLYRAAASYFYNTAMGTVPSGVGFVSTLEFVLALNFTSLLVALVVLLMLRKGLLRARGISQIPALAAVILGLALNSTGVLSSFPQVLSMAVSGVLCGVALMLLSAVWLEVFVAQSDPIHALVQIVAGFVIYGFLYIGLSLLPTNIAIIFALCALIVSSFIVVMLRRAFPASMEQRRPEKSMLRTDSLSVFINFFVLVGVVGILHTSVLGSSSEHIVGAVSMRGSILAATAIVVLIAILLGQKINPTTVYKVCFSCVIVIFSLLPFFGGAFGPFTGTLIIICYNVCGMVFFLFLV